MVLRPIFSSIFFSLLLVLPVAVFSQPSQEKLVAAEPGFARFVISQGENPTQSVTIYSNETGPFKVVDVTSPVSWITVKFRKADSAERVDKGKPGNAQYRLDITLDSTAAAVGPIAERITIKTNSSTTPEILFPVSGSIRHAGSPTRATGNATEGRISATVVDAVGSPLPGVKVLVSRTDGTIYDVEKTTGSDGVAHILIQDATKPYRIHIEKTGYISLDQDLQPKVGDVLSLTYTLKPKP
jgi:hypothetical protein